MNACKLRGRAVSLLILMAAAGCDNVNWGGADVTIVPPPPRTTAPSAGLPDDERPTERLPEGPVVYYVARAAQGATIVPVGELAGDSLRPLRPVQDARVFSERFIAEHMRQGAEFVLFRGGVRVGTLLVQNAVLSDAGACGPLPRGTGTLELSTAAGGVNEFIALSQLNAPQIPRRADAPLEATRTMTFVAPILAERMLRARGAQFPGNWQRAMQQVRAFPVATGGAPGFSATFLLSDTLGPGLDDVGWSLFFLAVPSAAQVGWDTVFVDFHDYARDGKRAPRVIDYLDWDRDDHVELLLQTYGVSDAWFEGVGRTDRSGWRGIFSDRCEQGDAPDADASGSRIPAPAAAPDTAGA